MIRCGGKTKGQPRRRRPGEFFIIFLYSCEETIVHDDEPDIDESSNFSIMGFSVNYDDNNDIISIYVETSSYENIISIESFVVNDINNDDQFTNNEIIDSNSLVQSEFNPNIFLYDGSLRLDNDVYIICINLSNIGRMIANIVSTNECNTKMPEIFICTLWNLP